MARHRLYFSNYDSPSNPFYGGGGAQAIHQIARRLTERHEVRVVVGAYPGCQDGPVDGVFYEHLGRAKAGGRGGQLGFQFRLPGRARRSDFDLWCESLTPPFSTACLQKFTARPVVALTQVMAGRGMTQKYKLPFATIERLGLRTYRHVIATSGHLRNQVLAANPAARTVVIPNGVPGELIRQELRRDPRHILFLGRFDIHQKGLDLLLDAYAGMVVDGPVPLILAGAGLPHEEAWIRRRIESLRLSSHVSLPGRVTGTPKSDLFQQAFFLALPSRFEASPLVAIEACCHGVPVVLSDIPELREFPETCGVKVRPESIADLAREMFRLWQDSPRREAMGRAGREFGRGFDWDDLAQRYEDCFESILRNG
ncbi:MAG: glycosyltransferase family 4 protein [Limisphaerales bacterium]